MTTVRLATSTAAAPAHVTDPVDRLAELRTRLEGLYPEREHVIRGMLAALVAGEHVLLTGPPGTAKSSLVQSFARGVGATFFDLLCGRFTTPDEVFGPLSLADLQRDVLRRVTTHRLPEAEMAFLDEVFKSGPGILNTTLRMLNERTFENGGQWGATPLRLCVGASNELPAGELDAFADRFAVRYEVSRLSEDEHVQRVLFGEATSAQPITAPVTSLADVDVLAARAASLPVEAEVKRSALAIRSEIEAKGVKISDRRWGKAIRVLRADCALAGAASVDGADLTVLADCLWFEAQHRAAVVDIVRKHEAAWAQEVRAQDRALAELAAQFGAVTGTGRALVSRLTEIADKGKGVGDSIKALANTGAQGAARTRLLARHAEFGAAVSKAMVAAVNGMGV